MSSPSSNASQGCGDRIAQTMIKSAIDPWGAIQRIFCEYAPKLDFSKPAAHGRLREILQTSLKSCRFAASGPLVQSRRICFAGRSVIVADIEELSNFVEGGEEYELRSSDDGKAYTLRFKTENQIVSLQGEDLEAFLKEYSLIKVQYPQYGSDQRLAQIWDQGGYSWLAAGQEEAE
jgi:hypothetical protein